MRGDEVEDRSRMDVDILCGVKDKRQRGRVRFDVPEASPRPVACEGASFRGFEPDSRSVVTLLQLLDHLGMKLERCKPTSLIRSVSSDFVDSVLRQGIHEQPCRR